MEVRLGIDTCFAVKRWPRPEDWAPIVADRLGLGGAGRAPHAVTGVFKVDRDQFLDGRLVLDDENFAAVHAFAPGEISPWPRVRVVPPRCAARRFL